MGARLMSYYFGTLINLKSSFLLVIILLISYYPEKVSGADLIDIYPTKTVRVIVGFPPGGSVDLQARLVLTKLSESLRQAVIIDNRAGADGAIGSEFVAKSTPDGYILMYGNAGHVTNQILHSKKKLYDAILDFTPIGLLTSSSFILTAHPSLPANNLKELIALTKTIKNELSYGSSGNGSFAHLSGELLKRKAGIKFLHVPYKGAAPSLYDLLGGQIPLLFIGPSPVMPHIKNGKIKVLAVTSSKRLRLLPMIQTIAEFGFPGFEVTASYGFFAPASTPRRIVERLNRDLIRIINLFDVREKLIASGLDIVGSSPEEHASHIKYEISLWTPIIKEAGIQID